MTKIKLLCLLLLCSCQVVDENAPKDEIDQQLMTLTSNAEKRAYLEEIFKEDQKYRQEQSSILMQRYGQDSDKYRNFQKISEQNDSLNLVKVERYIKSFGYPKLNQIGDMAAQTPWAVIHHSKHYEDKLRNFDVLRQAYKNGDIDGGAFALYLERMYNLKFQQRFEMDFTTYKVQVKIGALIRALEIEDTK